MSKITEISWQHVDFENDKSRFAVTVVVDTVADLPEPGERWMPGSMVIVTNTPAVYILNNEREWKKWQ